MARAYDTDWKRYWSRYRGVKKYGSKTRLVVGDKNLAILLGIAISEQNEKNKAQVKVMSKLLSEYFIRDYLDLVLKEAISEGGAYQFRNEKLGNVQVLEFPSKKGYKWDKEHGGKDWTIKWNHQLECAEIIVDEKYLKLAIKKADAGMKYSDTVIDFDSNIDELLKTLNA